MKMVPTQSLKNDFLIRSVSDEQLHLVSQEFLNTSELVKDFIGSYSCSGKTTILEVPITTEQLRLWELWFKFMQQKTPYEGTKILLRQLNQEKRDVLDALVRCLKIIPALQCYLKFCTAALKYPATESSSFLTWMPMESPESFRKKPDQMSALSSPSSPSLTWMPMESPESFRKKPDQTSALSSPSSSSSLSNLKAPHSFDWDEQGLPELFDFGFRLD